MRCVNVLDLAKVAVLSDRHLYGRVNTSSATYCAQNSPLEPAVPVSSRLDRVRPPRFRQILPLDARILTLRKQP